MEGKKQVGSSSSSFTADLFGTKESPPLTSSPIFASIFPPPPTLNSAAGRKFSNSEVIGSWQKQHLGNQTWNHTKQGIAAMSGEAAAICNILNKDRSSIFQEERAQPCHLSSSLYYGGQEIYSQSPRTQTSGPYPLLKKDGKEDDPNGNSSPDASRGNWWQGSLYY